MLELPIEIAPEHCQLCIYRKPYVLELPIEIAPEHCQLCIYRKPYVLELPIEIAPKTPLYILLVGIIASYQEYISLYKAWIRVWYLGCDWDQNYCIATDYPNIWLCVLFWNHNKKQKQKTTNKQKTQNTARFRSEPGDIFTLFQAQPW